VLPVRNPIRFLASTGFLTTSTPPTVIVPEVGLSIVAMSRSVVVFPAPFGPRRVKTLPGVHVKLMSRTASMVVPANAGPISRRCCRETLKVFVRCSTVIILLFRF
jgi:hypothetical protein